ncbi:GDYXXLXY domain-containing protein [Caenimonas sp. SL110]|uniref:GDYXXLXY domain-containing protein n=1 Tax=Caenimonas sp. SL110 TaxID=1450524 RepID=UPI000653CE25|nr:GDYXXLXY domain-containing protein [Caenimonas sp. SL110]
MTVLRPRNDGLLQALNAAIARGLLPVGAQLPQPEGRPWPVTLLVALGAWLAAIPLIAVVGILLGPLVRNSVGALFVGVLLLAASIVVLRSKDLPVFVEQLAVPGLLVGGAALGFAFFENLPNRGAACLLALVAVGVAAAIPRPWLRVLLGAAAAGLCVIVMGPSRLAQWPGGSMFSLWIALHGVLAVWLIAMLCQRQLGAPRAALVESLAAGWLVLLLAALAWWAGMTFLVGGSLGGGFVGEVAREAGSRSRRSPGEGFQVTQACSLILGLAALLWAGRRWPTLRAPAPAAAAIALAGLAWFLPSLGASLLVLAWTSTTHRWRLASAATVAAVWIVGSFYYQLAWPLTDKALVLALTGTVLGVLAWLARQKSRPSAASGPVMASDSRGTLLMVAGAVITLAVANFSIWQKESLIASGQKVFVALAPVDPRSLMQGDFMRLNYNIPTTDDASLQQGMASARPHVIARRDPATGVATLVRVAPSSAPLGAGEMRIELTPTAGRWMLVSDSWFFREGDGDRWQAARYGEFRVAPNGKALLVGMADANLKTIPIQP